MTRRLATAAALLFVACAAAAQEAPGPAPVEPLRQAPPRPGQAAPGPAPSRPPGWRRHDGLYVQLELGLGAMGSRASQRGSSLEASGAGGQLGLAIGGAVGERLLVGARLFNATVGNPSVRLDGADLGVFRGSGGLAGAGLDLRWYFLPRNLYLAATPAVTRLAVADEAGRTRSTDLGGGLRLAAGKEWWVGADWALGLDVEGILSLNELDFGAGPVAFLTSWIGLNLSATWN